MSPQSDQLAAYVKLWIGTPLATDLGERPESDETEVPAMQNRNRIHTAKWSLALMVLAMMPAASARALQQPQPTTTQDAAPPPVQPPDTAQPDQSKDKQKQKAVVVTGTIVKNGSDFVLKDTKGTVYQLDAQDKAATYENQAVKVTGKLEVQNQVAMLHVDSIEPMSA